MDKVAPILQKTISDFMALLGWSLADTDEKTLLATKSIGGNQLTWSFHFEDERSISQTGSPAAFASDLARKGAPVQMCDLIVPEKVVESRHWNDYLSPELQRAWSSFPNRRHGTATEFLNRFGTQIVDAFASEVTDRLKVHFVTHPVKPSFTSAEDALTTCATWVDAPTSPRLMLVTGDAGAGKSVFSLMVLQELRERFLAEPAQHPAPFLIWFTKDRPALIDDLIALTLNDIGLSQVVTPDAVRFLLEQGRLVFILDGFDEISRALAQNAEENIDELSKHINKRTRGRLLLTARPSFVMQEDLFTSLKSSCDADTHEEYELAPYTDSQMREWVIRNPPDGALRPPERHWQRLETAFNHNPPVKDLCRTPVFLRMISEVLVTRASVRSLSELLDEFCLRMWERERSKRPLTLSDDQYFHAYEAISVAVDEENRIQPRDIKSVLDLYFAAYCPELIASLPGSTKTLIDDLSIGPLTFKSGLFTFAHEVLAAYFLARLMVRHLGARRDILQRWNRPLKDTLRRFLPEVIESLKSHSLDSDRVLAEVVLPSTEGLAAWNIVQALRLPRDRYPQHLFAGKRLAGLVFDQADLGQLSFDRTELLDVTFDRCNLQGATFLSAHLHKAKFIQCGGGMVIATDSLQLDDESEVLITRDLDIGAELYTGANIRAILRELSGAPRTSVSLPGDVTAAAIVVIFSSLFKKDLRKLDYPEWSKVENRVRGWVREFGLSDTMLKDTVKILLRLADDLRDKGWISRNPNRSRTFTPSPQREQAVSEIVRLGKVTGHLDLTRIIASYQAELDNLRRAYS